MISSQTSIAIDRAEMADEAAVRHADQRSMQVAAALGSLMDDAGFTQAEVSAWWDDLVIGNVDEEWIEGEPSPPSTMVVESDNADDDRAANAVESAYDEGMNNDNPQVSIYPSPHVTIDAHAQCFLWTCVICREHTVSRA